MKRKFAFGESPVASLSEEIRTGQSNTAADHVSTNFEAQESEILNEETPAASKEAVKSPFLSNFEPQTEEVGDYPTIKKKKAQSAKKRGSRINGIEEDVSSIVVALPRSEYFKLQMLKLNSGRSLKSLTEQAVREFLERNPI